MHGGHSCHARLVRGLGDRHCGGLSAVTVTALALSEAGTFPTVNPRPVGSALHITKTKTTAYAHIMRAAAR